MTLMFNFSASFGDAASHRKQGKTTIPVMNKHKMTVSAS